MTEQMTDRTVQEPLFKRPELEDKEIITAYFDRSPRRSCERTFVNVCR